MRLATAPRRDDPRGAHADQQPMWRIGSQIPPSRMMIPWVVVLTVVVIGVAELGDAVAVEGAEAADAGPERASAATTAVHGTAKARSRRRRAWGAAVCMGCLPSCG